jgi:cell wall-associated NlpC family hydrolase
MHPTPAIIKEIRQLASASPSAEICGFVIDDKVVLPVENQHPDAASGAGISHKDFAKASSQGIITAIYHSHVEEGDEDFSILDIKSSRLLKTPYILCTKLLRIRYYDPCEILPYLGREWSWSSTNCYSLFQDYYKQELGIVLPDFYLKSPRAWEVGDVGYLENLPLNGFRRLDKNEPLQAHDVILMYVIHGLHKYPAHVAILTDPETGRFIHHWADQLSKPEIYGGDFEKRTHSVWRHESRDRPFNKL